MMFVDKAKTSIWKINAVISLNSSKTDVDVVSKHGNKLRLN